MTWYEEEVLQLEKLILGQDNHQQQMVFYGSSSIRLWQDLPSDFAAWNPLNMGFGGSTLAACVWFYERLIEPLNPRSLVLYAGDNDLGDGRHPEEVLIFYQMLLAKTRRQFGNIPLIFMSIKPSIARQHISHLIKRTNKLIRQEIRDGSGHEYFLDLVPAMLNGQKQPNGALLQQDGLHLSPLGYEVWKTELNAFLTEHLPADQLAGNAPI